MKGISGKRAVTMLGTLKLRTSTLHKETKYYIDLYS